jgi:hypothetical protein
LEVLKDYIDKNLESGFIRNSKSSAGAPILFVKKKDGSLRLCVDYRGLNKITVKNRYPLPLIPDLIDRLAGAKYFTKIDLRNAYNQIRIAKGDEYKTAFRTRYGLFEYCVMPFGLTNTPATFQALVNSTFAEWIDKFVVAYLDDILIFSRTLKEHDDHIRMVLQRLRKAKLYARPEKCEFYARSVDFLGFIIDAEGIRMDPAKLEAINAWPTPTSVRDAQSFLGFCNFYRQFIEGYSTIAKPLTDLTKKGTSFYWNDQENAAFLGLKKAFSEADILRHADPTRPYTLETDASGYAMGAILSQMFDDGFHPIDFFSRKFTPTEMNYTVTDKEMLAIHDAFQHWRHYLEGAPHETTVLTDHQALVYFAKKKNPDPQKVRWLQFLQNFNYNIVYRPGRLGTKPDALSRRPDYARLSPPPIVATDTSDTLEPQDGTALPLFPSEGVEPTATTDTTEDSVLEGGESPPTLTIAAARKRIGPQRAPKTHTAHSNETVLSSVTYDTIKAGQATDDLCIAIKQRITDGTIEKTEQRFKVDREGLLRWDHRLYVPDVHQLRLSILQDSHDSPLAGHPGREKTIKRIAEHYYWPGYKAFVTKFVQSCERCARNKARRHAPYGLLKSLPRAL